MSTQDINDSYFNPGSVVKCVTYDKEVIKGEVVAFDHDSQMLMLKNDASDGNRDHNDVVIVNLSFVSDIQTLKECVDLPPALPPVDEKKLLKRTNEQNALRMTVAQAVTNGVTEIGVEVFLCFKRIYKETKFRKQNIVIMDDVTIEPPYQLQNCSANSADNADRLLRFVKVAVSFYSDNILLTSYLY